MRREDRLPETAPPTTKKRLELLQELPQRVPYVQSFLARHLTLGKEVELRIAPETDEKLLIELFKLELIVFSGLDHPAFPPVLERGLFNGRYYYVVPRREHPTLSKLIASEDLTLEDRCRAVRSVAAGVAAAHAKGLALGRIYPELVAWDEATGYTYLLHVPGPPAPELTTALPPPPEHLPGEDLPPPNHDVFHWGLLAYWLLAGGIRPFGGQDQRELFPLRTWTPALHADLYEAVEACLGEDAERRPGNGLELHQVLRIQHRDLLDPDAPVGDSALESATDLKRSLFEARRRVQPPPEIEPPRNLQGLLPDSLESPLESLRSLPMGKLAMGLGAAAAALLLALVGCPQAEVGPAPAARTTTAEVGSDYARDPYVRHLLKEPTVSPETFQRSWTLVRNLALRKRLPPELDDLARIDAMDATFKKDPRAGAEEMERFLARFRELIKD